MLIDETYFIGPLTIAQLGQKSVIDGLKDIINRFEPVILEAALGYDFYQSFLEGLDASSDEVIEQRWLNLLNGFVFTNIAGIKKRWVGFAGGQNTQTAIAAQRDDLFIYAGITAGFPVAGYQYTDPSLKGWNYTVELFGAGTIQPEVEWNYKAGGGIVLTDTTYTTSPGERWVIHFTGKKIGVVQSSTTNQFSTLAAFIYYEYMKDLANQNTGIGYVKNEGENSAPANVVRKPLDAFNYAASQIRILWEYFQADQALDVKVYPEFDPRQIIGYYGVGFFSRFVNSAQNEIYSFRTKNPYGI